MYPYSCKQQSTDCTSGTGPLSLLYAVYFMRAPSAQAHAIGVRWKRRDPITSAAGGPPRGATGAPCRAPAVACVCGAARATGHGAGAVRPIGHAAAPAARRAIASARPDAASRAAAASGPASGLASRRRRPASACRRRPRWRARSAAPGLELGPGLGLGERAAAQQAELGVGLGLGFGARGPPAAPARPRRGARRPPPPGLG